MSLVSHALFSFTERRYSSTPFIGNATGTHSFYTKWNELEIMFHIAPMLPYNASDRQQLERKRHLGNDIVVIVFVDSNSTYDPATIKSHFNHVVFVVQPELSGGVTRYK
jgi:RAP1 GTPase activating protein 1